MLPVDDYLHYLETQRDASPHTLRAYGRDLGELREFFGAQGVAWATARPDHLKRYLHTLHGKVGATTLARKLAAFRSFYRWALTRHLVTKSPCDGVRSPKAPKRAPEVLEPEAVVRLIEAEEPRTREYVARNAALVEVMYGGGLRVSEVVGLDLTDVDLRERLVRVRMGKGRKDRIVPMGQPAIDAVAAWVSLRPELRPLPAEPALFLNRYGRRLSARSVGRMLDDRQLRAGVFGVHPHVLRHSAATHLLDGGAELRHIQEYLGHARLQTTQRYTQVSIEKLMRTYDAAHPRAGGHGPADADDGHA